MRLKERIFYCLFPATIKKEELSSHYDYFNQYMIHNHKAKFSFILCFIMLIGVLEYLLRPEVDLQKVILWRGLPSLLLIASYFIQLKDSFYNIIFRFVGYTLSLALFTYFQFKKNQIIGMQDFGYYILPLFIIAFLIPYRFAVIVTLYSASAFCINFGGVKLNISTAVTYFLLFWAFNILCTTIYRGVEKASIRLQREKQESENKGKKMMQYSYSSAIRSIFSTMKSMPDALQKILDSNRTQEQKEKRLQVCLDNISIINKKMEEISNIADLIEQDEEHHHPDEDIAFQKVS